MMANFTRLVILGLAVAFVTGAEYSDDDIIHSPGATPWGIWGHMESCELGSYVYGFELKVEKEEAAMDDDTSVNAIELFCRTPEGHHTGVITSSTMGRGCRTGAHHCPDGFIYGYDLKSQPPTGDDTAANALRMWCNVGDVLIEAPGNRWGNYIGRSTCPSGKAICGIMTLVEPDKGTFGDDTALNDVKFRCCDLP